MTLSKGRGQRWGWWTAARLLIAVVPIVGSHTPASAAGQLLVNFPLDDSSDGANGFAPDPLDASALAGSTIASGPGLGVFSVGTDSWSGSVEVLKTGPGMAVSEATAQDALDNDWYFDITLTPSSAMHLTSVSADWSRGGTTSSRGWFVRSSRDAYASDLYSNQTPAGTSTGFTTASFDLAGFRNLADPVTFRFFIYTDSTGRYMDFQNIEFFGHGDTTAPEVVIARAGSGTLASGDTDTITFTLSEPATDFTAADITTVGGTLSGFAGSGTTYTATFAPSSSATGTASIDVAAGTFTDAASNDNTAAAQLTIAYDTSAPSVVIARAGSGTLAEGDTDTITVTLSESATDFTATDITITGGTLSGFAGSGTTYTATVTPTSDTMGAITIDVAAGTFTDAAGNPNLASTTLTLAADTTTTTVPATTSTVPAAPAISMVDVPSTGEALARRSDGVEVRSEVTVESSDTASTITIRNDDGSEITIVHQPTSARASFTLYGGTSLTISGGGYLPGTDIDVWLYSSPTYVGTTTTTADGTFTVEVVIPGDVELGDHVLQVEGTVLADVEQATFIGFQVLDPTVPGLPTTGRDASESLAVLLLAVGLMLMIGASRRRTDTADH